MASRAATLIIVLLSIVVTYFMNRITDGWELVLALGAGTGLVYILRWYWWRINAWSEVSAMISALVVSLLLRYFEIFDASTPKGFAQTILTTVGVTTLVWVVVTYLTRPEPLEKLTDFFRKVQPAGPGWREVARLAGLGERRGEIAPNLLNWLLGVSLVYTTLFGIGEVIFGGWARAAAFILVAALCGVAMTWNLNRTGWVGLAESSEAEVSEAAGD
jgi:hypothetical protein